MDLKSGHAMDGWWIDDRLTYGWLFSGVLLAYLLVYRKNSGKFPAFYFSGKVTTLNCQLCHAFLHNRFLLTQYTGFLHQTEHSSILHEKLARTLPKLQGLNGCLFFKCCYPCHIYWQPCLFWKFLHKKWQKYLVQDSRVSVMGKKVSCT